jgi:hypothetical protein
MAADGVCEKPFMVLHDVGLTFGHGNFWNRTVTGSVNFDLWSKTRIWRDAAACVGHLSKRKPALWAADDQRSWTAIPVGSADSIDRSAVA